MRKIADIPPATLHEVHEFLLGNAPLDGVWFGEPNPKRFGAYWWRGVLFRATLSKAKPRKTK